MKVLVLLLLFSVPLEAQDRADLSQADICSSYPSNVLQRPTTTLIHSLVLGKDGVHVDFDKKDGPSRWPDVTPPGWTGSLQFTLCIGMNLQGRWRVSCPIEYWYSLEAAGDDVLKWIPDRQLFQIPANWTYDCGTMARQPQAGEQIAFFVVAGDARKKDVALVQERSNVVLVTWPSATPAAFNFDTPTPVPTPIPTPLPQPTPTPQPSQPLPSTDLSQILNYMTVAQAAINARFDQLQQQVQAVDQHLAEFRSAVKSKWDEFWNSPIVKYGLAALAAFVAGKQL